jgi:phage shock protein PspC (stress-responsive transcriptional regulator)
MGYTLSRLLGLEGRNGVAKQLTQRQKARVDAYLDEVADALGSAAPVTLRERTLARLRDDIHRELDSTANGDLTDHDVEAVLRLFGSAEGQAAERTIRSNAGDQLLLTQDDRVWLGVCGGIAARLGFPAWQVRLVLGALGLAGPLLSVLAMLSSRSFSSATLGIFTGSVALLIYLGLYGYMYVVSPKDDETRIRWGEIVANVAITLIVALALFYVADYGLQLIRYMHTTLLDQPMPDLGTWGWYRYQADNLFFWAMAAALPLAVLGGLPLANGWNDSLRRLGQASLAIYGVALAFGMASVLTGLILDLLQNRELLEGLGV